MISILSGLPANAAADPSSSRKSIEAYSQHFRTCNIKHPQNAVGTEFRDRLCGGDTALARALYRGHHASIDLKRVIGSRSQTTDAQEEAFPNVPVPFRLSPSGETYDALGRWSDPGQGTKRANRMASSQCYVPHKCSGLIESRYYQPLKEYSGRKRWRLPSEEESIANIG